MSNIPADKPFKQPPLVEEAIPKPTYYECSKVAQNIYECSKVAQNIYECSKVAQNILAPTSDSTRSPAPLDINPNTDPSKTTETTTQVAASILRPRSIEQLRKLAIVNPNPEKSLRELDVVSFLKTLKPPFPSREVFQKIIKQIKNVDTLLEIWTELIKKPEDDSLEDSLVDVFQAIYQKNRDSSFTAYTETGQRIKLKKRIADCIKPDDYEFFLDNAIQKNYHFSIVLFLKKFYRKNVSEGNWDFLEKYILHSSKMNPGQLLCKTLLVIYSTSRMGDSGYLSVGMFQHLGVDFFEAGWGTKEEFITKALCSFWKNISSPDYEDTKEDLENLENGILDIGVSQDPTLSSGNSALFVLLFSVGILFPTIQEKIRARGTSPFQVKPSELERDYARLDPNSKEKKFIDKIRTLLLPPEEAIKNLEEVDPLNTESFPCIRAKHPQFSGSCGVKNLNSLLSMSSLAPSIIMQGGFKYHAVYAEVFRLDDQYFALVHNLGGGLDYHPVNSSNKILPLVLYFEKKEHLIKFSKMFCDNETTKKEYLKWIKAIALNSRNKNIEKELDRVHLKSSSMPFARSLVYPDKDRTNPMYPEYRKFRELQKEIIQKLIDPTGSPSAVKAQASVLRRNQKRQLGGGQ